MDSVLGGGVLVAVAAALWLLPRFKGMMVGFQWAKRMHGFASGLTRGSAEAVEDPA